MSETVHYKGIAREIPKDGKTILELATSIIDSNDYINREDYYDNDLENLIQEEYNRFFYHPKTDTLYEISYTEHNPDEEIIRAEINKDGFIDFELRYYNGGAGFGECLEEAMDKL